MYNHRFFLDNVNNLAKVLNTHDARGDASYGRRLDFARCYPGDHHGRANDIGRPPL
jgi:hypothetical protein